jgi:PKD-like domain
MLRFIFICIALCWHFFAQAQIFPPLDVTGSYNPSPAGNRYITAVCEDTTGNRLFTAIYGSPGPNLWDLRKTNLSSGVTNTIATYAAATSGLPIPTRKIIYNNHKLYINRNTLNQNTEQIAALDTNGVVLWSYTFTQGLNDSIFDFALSVTGDTLFVAGSFIITTPVALNFLAAFNANTGQLLTGWTHNIDGNEIRKVFPLGNKLFLGGNFFSGAVDNLARFSLTATGPVLDAAWKPDPNGTVYDIAPAALGNLAVVGEFTQFLPVSVTINRSYFAYVNATTNTVVNSVNPVFNGPVRQVEVYYGNSTITPLLLLAGEFTNASGSNFEALAYPSTLQNWNPGITPYRHPILLSRFRNRLYVSAARKSSASSPYKVYCFAPPQPGTISYSSTAFCRGGNPITASLTPVLYAAAYTWSYSGTGVTLSPSGNSVQLIFGLNATSGTLSVTAQSDCGLLSQVRNSAITLLPSPNVSAGPDDTLTCLVNAVVVNGSTTTPGTSLQWTFPNSQQFSDSSLTPDPGQYIITAVAPNQCIWRDTMQVRIDTTPPVVQPFGTVNDLTCTTDTVWLDAAALYPGDSLRWNTLQGVFPNPYAATLSGNYLLYIHNRSNGCESSDTIFVNENTTPPPVLLPASIDTLTCLLTAVQLNSPPVTGGVQVWNLVGDTVFVNNPATVSVPGNYILTTTSLINGCLSQGVVNVNQFITPPNVTVPANVPVLNCSFDSVSIDGSSTNIGAGLWWTGPGNFSSADPAVVTQQGVYVLTVTHPQNGCTRSDSITVNYVNTLTVITNTDTTICPGSGAVLTAAPVGGTPGFSISWDNNGGNGSPVTVYPADSLTYIVTINDNAGCVGTDTVRVHVPDVLSDSTLSFQPCDPLQPTGQVQVYALGGVPPYQYSIDGGSTFQNSGVFGNLGYGNYSFIIRDTLGCTRSTSAVIDTNSLSPAPDFLLSTNPDMGDTVVIVDISNPRPDSVNWIFPPSVTVIDSNQFAPVILYGDTGSFTITMQAYYGSCEVNYVRNVIIGPFVPGGASPWNNNGIDTLIVYPNPNNGTFTVDLQLHAEQTFVIQVFDANGIERFRMPPLTTDNWNGSITIPGALPGNYQLRVTAEYDSESRIIIVTQ